jgi:hypothetical protein
MNKKTSLAFAHWLAKVHPDIFLSIVRNIKPQTPLGDISDVLSSIGTTLGDAASAVGDWISNPQNINSLSSVATAYFRSQTPSVGNAQNAVFQTQLQRSQYGQMPVPINYAQNASGQVVPMYNGQVLSPTQLQSLQPNFLQKYGLVLAVGGGALFLILLLSR